MDIRVWENETESCQQTIPERLIGGIRHYISDIRRFSRNVRLYLIGSALMGLNFQVFLVLFNLYLRELGYPEGDIGHIISARAVGMTLIAIPAAILLGRLRLKPFLMVSCISLAIFSYVMVTYPVFQLMALFAILSGMSFAIFRVASGPFFMRNSTRVERTHVFSFSFGTMLLAGMIGSVASGELAAAIGAHYDDIIIGYRYALYIGIVIALLALAPFAMISAADPARDENRIRLSRSQLRRRGKFYFKIMLANLIIGSGAGLIIPFLTLYFRDRFGLPPDTIGMYYALVHFAMLAGTLAGPVLAR
jgi:MFS family permease